MDRCDRNIGVERSEVCVNGEAGGIGNSFYRGLRHTPGLARKEEVRLDLVHVNEAIEGTPRPRRSA